jgi:hypothetical protein
MAQVHLIQIMRLRNDPRLQEYIEVTDQLEQLISQAKKLIKESKSLDGKPFTAEIRLARKQSNKQLRQMRNALRPVVAKHKQMTSEINYSLGKAE